MSVGTQLLLSVLSAPTLEQRGALLSRLTDAGVSSRMFSSDGEKQAFDFIVDYRARYGVCPSPALVEVETPLRFPRYASQHPFDFWFDEFRKYVKHGVLLELVELVEGYLVDGKVDDAVTCLGNTYAGLTDLMNERKSTATLSDMVQPILEKHHLLQSGLLREGIFTGFPYIDRVTGGAQPGDTWVIAGESSSGKTYALCKCVMSAVAAGKKCVFLSMEMPNLQLGRRVLAMGAAVSATGLRLGRLSRFGLEQLYEFRDRWDDERDRRLVFVEGRVNFSIRDVKARVKEIKPDALFIDGAYMLRGLNPARARWEMNLEVMETLKQFAMEENIAIISTFQFDQKQKMKNLSTIMGGQAIGQLASVVIGIETEAANRASFGVQYKEMTLYKGREGESGKIRLRYDMNRACIEQESVIEGDEEPERDFSPQPEETAEF